MNNIIYRMVVSYLIKFTLPSTGICRWLSQRFFVHNSYLYKFVRYLCSFIYHTQTQNYRRRNSLI